MENLKKEFGNITKLSKEAGKELQSLLNKNGYNLTVDGIVGKNTINAFNDFKTKNNLSHPSEIGQMTFDVLIKNAQNANFIYPTEGRLSSPYGYRIHPIRKTKTFHAGIDLANNYGTPIVASHSGTVIFSGTLGGYGYAIKIQEGNKTTLYGHCDKLLVKQGQKVKQGDRIANMGSSGNSTGPHLHFEIHLDEKHVNPIQYLNA